MPLTPSVAVSQSALSPSQVVLTDNSTGSDGNIVSRRVSFQNADGDYLTPNGTSSTIAWLSWPYADVSATFIVLTEDAAVYLDVQWLDGSGNVLYSAPNYYAFLEYNKQFAVYLGQLQAATPGIIKDSNYLFSMAAFWNYITYATVMIEVAADISNSQNLINKATEMRLNESKFF